MLSVTARIGDRLNGFNNGKTQQFNSGGVVKWAYFQKKKVESPFKNWRPYCQAHHSQSI